MEGNGESRTGEAVRLDLTGRDRPSAAPDLHLPQHRETVEAALRELPEVTAVRLVPGLDRPVDEVHVVADASKPAKPLVRDVQSLLYARFGLSVDHRVISVVQIDRLEDELDVGTTSTRVEIARVAVAQEGLEARAVVQLRDGERELTGESTGPSSAAGRRRTTARATLEAVRPLLGDRHIVEIEAVAVEDVLGHDVAITFVHIHGGRGERTISGTALVRDDEAAAVARSVLDALNRELAPPST